MLISTNEIFERCVKHTGMQIFDIIGVSFLELYQPHLLLLLRLGKKDGQDVMRQGKQYTYMAFISNINLNISCRKPQENQMQKLKLKFLKH